MDTEILGRDEELARIDAFVALGGPRALLIEGEAGIGKTTLWKASVERARASGHVVLQCSPSHAESDVAFAALGDLLRAVGAAALEALPAPQRRALEGALLLREPERPPEGRALGLGLVRLLDRLASTAKLIVAIDDTQWLDAASRDVITFAARRLGELDVGLLMARRTGEGDPAVPLELDRAFPPDALEICLLEPMSLGALGRLVRKRLGVELHRPELLRLEALSAGNPLFAVELAPTLLGGAAERLPTSLSAAVHARLAGLDDDTLDALLAAAVSPSPTLATVEDVAGTEEVWELLKRARDAQIVTLDGEAVQFVHPLYAAAIVERSSPKRVAEEHRRLASLAPTRELRARHLAASADEPDEEVAAEVEAGARDALLRGAPEIAAELAAQAHKLTLGKATRHGGSACSTSAGSATRRPPAATSAWPATRSAKATRRP